MSPGTHDETLAPGGLDGQEETLARLRSPHGGVDDSRTVPHPGPPSVAGTGVPNEPTLITGATVPEVPVGPTEVNRRETPEDYELLEELGRGGMGVVYKARQVKLNRLTALKMVLAGTHASKAELDRFGMEAKAVARLQHPNIVQIYEVGQRDGRPFFSLEYIDGGSLADRLDGTPLPARRAAELTEQLARAVHYAHDNNVIHRDLKPANVLLTRDGSPKITDFGLAKSLGEDSSATGTGAILGTPSYMSPEQAMGHTREVGPAADVYALGAMLYEMLSGRPPFRGQSVMDTLKQVQDADPVPPGHLQPGVPRDLETICLKCLRKEPEKRYPSAGNLADDLLRFLAGEPITARPVGLWERGWKWARRRPAVATLLLSLALVISGGLAAVTVLWLQAEHALGEARAAKQLAEQRERDADEASKKYLTQKETAEKAEGRAVQSYQAARVNLYVSRMAQALQAVRAGQRDQALTILGNLSGVNAGDEDLRGFEWYYLDGVCRSPAFQLQGHTQRVTQVAFSADGTQLATAGLDGTVKIWAASPPRERLTLPGSDRPVRALAFSPDGKVLAAGDAGGRVRLWDAGTGEEVTRFAAHPQAVRCLGFAPDGRHLATGGADGDVKVWEATTWKLVNQFAAHTYPVTALACSPDGTLLATGGEDNLVKVWAWRDGAEEAAFRGHTLAVSCLAFNPDGKSLASGGQDRTVRLWDLEQVKEPRVLRGHTWPLRSVAFNPTGTKLASSNGNGGVKVWDLLNDLQPQDLPGEPGLVRTVAFSPDGQLLASVRFHQRVSDPTPAFSGHAGAVGAVVLSPDGATACSAGVAFDADSDRAVTELLFWGVADRKMQRVQTLPDLVVRTLAVSPDGRYLACAGEENFILVIDFTSGEEAARLTGHSRRVLDLAFQPKGQFLASASADGTVKLWEVPKGREVRTLAEGPYDHAPVCRVAFSPDGRRLAAGGDDHVVRLWDVGEGKLARTLSGHRAEVSALAFAPDGADLASGSADGTLILWDINTGEPEHNVAGHRDAVAALAFTPGGQRLVSGGADQLVKIWDAATCQETLPLTGHTGAITGLDVTPDGQRVLTSSADRTVRVWEGVRDSR